MIPSRRKLWIVVADASRARIFRAGSLRGPYELVTSLDHAAGRAKLHELVTDDRGRRPVGPAAHRSRANVNGMGRPYGRPAVQPEVDAKEHERMSFARELARRLDRGCEDGEFDDLFVVAASRFLGLLKARLHPRTRDRVRFALGRDYSQLAPSDLALHVQAVAAGP